MPINPVHIALHEQRQGADRRRIGERRDGDELPGRRLGSREAEDPSSRSRSRGTCSATAWWSCPTAGCSSTAATCQYDPFHGQPRNAVYDPATGVFTDVQNMAHGRWYPTVTMLGDGRVMTFSGLTETGGTNTDGGDSTRRFGMESGVSGRLDSAAVSAHAPDAGRSRLLLRVGHRLEVLQSIDERRGRRSSRPPTTAATRTYGTSVLLPLTPANGYRPRVMIIGGGNPATATTEIIDLSAADAAVAVRTVDVAAADSR